MDWWQVNDDRSNCVAAAENQIVQNGASVTVVPCDDASDNQKWVFDVANNQIQLKADSRYCIRVHYSHLHWHLHCPASLLCALGSLTNLSARAVGCFWSWQ